MDGVEELYRRYSEDVYRYLCSITRDAALSEDLLSETFLRAIRAVGGFRGDASVKTWLCTIARHAWIDEMRRRRPQLSYDDLLAGYVEDAAPDDPARSAVNAAVAARAKELLHTRRPVAEKVFLLRAQGYSFAEIAQTCGISESSARTVEFRTRRWLRETLQQEGFCDD